MRRTPGRSDWHLRLLRPGVVCRVCQACRYLAPGLFQRVCAALSRNDQAMQLLLQKSVQNAQASAFYCYLCGGLSLGAAVAAHYLLPLPFLIYFTIGCGVVFVVSGIWYGRNGEKTNFQSLMSSTYHQLLDATIQHLEDLKSRGVRHVAVAPETLRALAQPLTGKPQTVNPKSAASGAPASGPARTELRKTRRVGDRRFLSLPSSRRTCSRCRAKPFPARRRRWIRRQRPPPLPPCANGRWPV